MPTFKKDKLRELRAAVPQHSEVLLVRDEGVYIKCAAQPVGKRTIVYPKADRDWWETACRLVGGDDFGDPLATAGALMTSLTESEQGLKVTVTDTQVITETY